MHGADQSDLSGLLVGGSLAPVSRVPPTIPSRAGVGLKGKHAADILEGRPEIGWFEIHPENYMVDGGPRLQFLERVRQDYPISIHGVALSLAGAAPPDAEHLKRLKALIDRFDAGLVSEHMAWSDHGGVYFADLLPVTLNQASLRRLCDNIDVTQTAIGRSILIENPSNYLVLPGAEMDEIDFIVETCRRTGCGLLVDINNVFVSAANVGIDARAYVDAIPAHLVGEIHLAGHERDTAQDQPILLIDSHGAPVADAVWQLFDHLIGRIGPRPTLIEWDNDVPDWPVLAAEAERADRHLVRSLERLGSAA